ncbi:bifunctional 3-hydroxydecanoyl-ACP dehydratase/trans-2-decenoyl-ACP isomerase [Syntrophus aciditrophicus]|jgi:3-hydroxyacyl-[acyl-carrier protein] dehydratase/trans-2-decenoyl-[acyl-carrier protein] isomerase|uniref:3-hydroxydecanoyl-[acyl-carrier-protein] dehydratase n=1 Tax=Syntrophus aciditrophicus (strain SB) TaxID=56780 RepID=Q2LXQ5_SYNAS|nr:bifunctional 3-hydroxydecanoyl-ACP dehydratase/trans-2-decenoyl-ACP isomerase [Syntrophus aciditrophicus]ABC78865.1 3-hydroxydecanoyl-[acyl-carrier-protein] dehydratase [Syntrophus aciditrophicus SB]OPY19305.1 MAG: 3-hydroxydecanoyl-(acyl-carrier-protein) dehydratase [Syntrophus sp. PtaB.Bin075]
MTYEEFCKQGSFSLEDLLAFAYGNLVDDRPDGFDARLPAPPFLMLDRILTITSEGRQGRIVAEQDIRLDAWYFQCHMPGDPVQPGCLCVDAIWQLLGFYCVWRGALGAGRALGCKNVSFNGQIRPYNRCVRYEVDIRRFSHLKDSGASIVIGDAKVFVDNELITEITQAQTGVFSGIVYPDYPKHSRNSVGGMIRS